MDEWMYYSPYNVTYPLFSFPDHVEKDAISPFLTQVVESTSTKVFVENSKLS